MLLAVDPGLPALRQRFIGRCEEVQRPSPRRCRPFRSRLRLDLHGARGQSDSDLTVILHDETAPIARNLEIRSSDLRA